MHASLPCMSHITCQCIPNEIDYHTNRYIDAIFTTSNDTYGQREGSPLTQSELSVNTLSTNVLCKYINHANALWEQPLPSLTYS